MEERKTALVTGSSRGIGAAIAKHLCSLGMRVALTYSHSKQKAEKLMDELTGKGHILTPLDVTDEDSVKKAFQQIIAEFGNLHGLVNNAGITRDQLVLRMKTSEFDEVIQTNLRGTFLCTQQALRPMIKAKRGSIVNITSVIGQMGAPGQTNYAASKAGMEAFSRSVAREAGSRNIRVNCVAPGFITTDMTKDLPEERKQAILSSIPLGSIGQPMDVANLVAFLLSDESKYITGQTIGINGGLFM